MSADVSRGECPLVLVTWEDSRQPLPTWTYLSEIPKALPVLCATVGWMLRDQDDVKVICQTIGDEGHPENAQASGIMTIPTRSVVSIHRLEEVLEDEPANAPSMDACDQGVACSPTLQAIGSLSK